jgi:PTS system fructose-specific IIC component
MPAKIFFMIAAPEDNHNLHVEMLGRLAILLISQRFREKLMHIDSKEKFVTFIERMEAKETENIE